MTNLKRTGVRLLAASAAALFLAVGAAAAPAAASFGTPTDTGFNGCTVPSGYTYDYTFLSHGCLGGVGFHIIKPADGVWACKVPLGWTYDYTETTYHCLPYGYKGKRFHLRGGL